MIKAAENSVTVAEVKLAAIKTEPTMKPDQAIRYVDAAMHELMLVRATLTALRREYVNMRDA